MTPVDIVSRMVRNIIVSSRDAAPAALAAGALDHSV
jgi:hypothetical protein